MKANDHIIYFFYKLFEEHMYDLSQIIECHPSNSNPNFVCNFVIMLTEIEPTI
jgi:predicted ABC-type exoprotein transport system permease subunit